MSNKENFFEKRNREVREKIDRLTSEIGQWQKIFMAQQQQIERLELNFSALMATLNRQSPFRKFDSKYMAEELDRMIQAHREQVEAVIAKATEDAQSSNPT